MHCITVEFALRAGFEAAFVDAVRDNARRSLAAEPGCRRFDVCVDGGEGDRGGARRVFLYELYDDEAAFGAHLRTPHFLAFDAQVAPWVERKAVRAWRCLPA